MVDGRSVFDELIGPPDADHRDLDALFAVEFEDGSAVTAHEHMVFKRDHHLGDVAKPRREFAVDGFGEARVDDGAVEPFGTKQLSGFLRTHCMFPKAKNATLW